VRVSVCVWDSEGGSGGERGRRGEGWGWGGVGGFKLNLKRATLGVVLASHAECGLVSRDSATSTTAVQVRPLPPFLSSVISRARVCHGVRIMMVQVGDRVRIASSVLDAAISAKSFVADVANQVVSALTSLGQTVPMLGPCVRVLQDIMAVYKVVPLRPSRWHTCARAAGSRLGVTVVAVEMRCRMIPPFCTRGSAAVECVCMGCTKCLDVWRCGC
jgi:hypothetical protein